MHRALCICSLEPRVETRTRLLLVLHKDEERKPTNTGQLAARALINSSVVVTGDQARPLPLPLVRPEEQPVLLFPADDAVPLTDFASSARPVCLIVPDGTWRQAGKVGARVPGLAGVPRVHLPADDTATAYRLRRETKDGGLATLEAIARALAVLEGERGPSVAAALLAIFRVQVERTLWLRGALRDDEVTGGLPAAALLPGVRG